ncbi:MAG TPA: hypothetical protein VEX15_08440 [Nocardioidaceae bacterium]|nr:hypothetical protein [Nocardioidaceae bacterium]
MPLQAVLAPVLPAAGRSILPADLLPTQLVEVDPVTDTAQIEISTPGQVAIVAFDHGWSQNNRVTVEGSDSTFPAGTRFSLSQAAADSRPASQTLARDVEQILTTTSNQTGSQWYVISAGPHAVGTMNLTFDKFDW